MAVLGMTAMLRGGAARMQRAPLRCWAPSRSAPLLWRRGVVCQGPVVHRPAVRGFASAAEEEVDGGSEIKASDVIPVLHKVQELLGHTFQFPRLVMVGEQSSGKTSVIEAVIGADISVKDATMATRRPLLLTLMRISHGSMWAKFRDGEKMYNFEDVKKRIAIENEVTVGDIASEPIELTIYSPTVYDTVMIDLPGFIAIPGVGQDDDLPDQIQDLNRSYMNDPRNILTVVNSAVADPMTSMALRESMKSDPTSTRSLGIVTKVDLAGKNKDALARLLQNQILPLGMGRVGIRCRTQQEQLDGVSFEEVIDREQEWIDESKLQGVGGIRLGVPKLREVLSATLVERIVGELPTIIAQLDKKIEEVRHNQGFLQQLASQKDMTSLAHELEGLVNLLHPAADTRQDFEKELRENLHTSLAEMIAEAAEGAFDFSKVPSSRRTAEGKPIPHAGPLLKELGYDAENMSKFDPQRFRDVLVFGGQGNTDGITAGSIAGFANDTTKLGAVTAFFEHSLPSNMRRARTTWVSGLNHMVDKLMGDKVDVGPAVYGLFTKQLNDFALNAEVSHHGGATNAAMNEEQATAQSKLAKLYFKFLLEKIAARIHEEGLAQEIEGMIERERRPTADFFALQSTMARSAGFPHHTHKEIEAGWFSDNQGTMAVTMFNAQWTQAYLDLLTRRVADDVFRIIAVRLLQPLVFESIQFSLTLFSSGGKMTREVRLGPPWMGCSCLRDPGGLPLL